MSQPDPNPLHALYHRMTAKGDEIDQAPEMFTEDQLDRIRATALLLSQKAGMALAARRGGQ